MKMTLCKNASHRTEDLLICWFSNVFKNLLLLSFLFLIDNI